MKLSYFRKSVPLMFTRHKHKNKAWNRSVIMFEDHVVIKVPSGELVQISEIKPGPDRGKLARIRYKLILMCQLLHSVLHSLK